MQDTLRLLGKRIRDLRIKKGFRSQEAFADYCGMHRTFLGHLETGRKDFRLSTIIRVAESLGVTVEELFSGMTSGEAVKSKKPARSTLDRAAVRKELETLERNLKNLKMLLSPRERKLPNTPSKPSKAKDRPPGTS